MDWVRKLLGYHDGSREHGNPFQSPTWEEIIRKRNSQKLEDSEDLQHPWGHVFHGGFYNSDMFSPPREFEDPHSLFFGQMDDMFSHLEGLMKELHRHPAWTLPDSTAEHEPQTPRDYMLKMPDSDSSGTMNSPGPHHPNYGYGGEDWGAQSDHGDIGSHINPFAFSPYSFFDRIFQNFGMHSDKEPFSGHLPEIGSGPDPGDHSRESLMKKRDLDIDNRVLGDISKIPEGGPGYSHDVPQTTREPMWSPQSQLGSPEVTQPGVRHRFYSQSIVTIRRPDGSIEETKKYSDSNGREEVTVTHKQPDDGSYGPGPLQPGGPMDHQGPSTFSWFFTR